MPPHDVLICKLKLEENRKDGLRLVKHDEFQWHGLCVNGQLPPMSSKLFASEYWFHPLIRDGNETFLITLQRIVELSGAPIYPQILSLFI